MRIQLNDLTATVDLNRRESTTNRLLVVPLILVSCEATHAAPIASLPAFVFPAQTMVCFCHPSPPPYLFGPRSLVERAWSPTKQPNCLGTGGRSGAVCEYRAGARRVAVTYGSKNQAVKFVLAITPNSMNSRNWAFLVRLLPKRAKLDNCQPAENSSHRNSGRICRYHYAFEFSDGHRTYRGHTVEVATYANASTTLGVVEALASRLTPGDSVR